VRRPRRAPPGRVLAALLAFYAGWSVGEVWSLWLAAVTGALGALLMVRWIIRLKSDARPAGRQAARL